VAARRVRAIDRLAVERPGADREQLAATIVCGDVTFDGQVVRNPKELVSSTSVIERVDSGFVGRGGTKLDHALLTWEVPVAGKIFLDAGASTGGFTDALLRRGAACVHAVDVGYNQLDYRLRTDPRVLIHERTNIMEITDLDPEPHAAVVDLSFRSLRGAAAHILGLTRERWAVMLLKPQFEWREPPAEFNGLVPDDRVAAVVLDAVGALLSESVHVHRCLESPIAGRSGNREFLLLVRDAPAAEDACEIVRQALESREGGLATS
jgi:23S rRNA (cytidine1920-2'-O)/16S rRNA (cytidine1409-2'-O)-methyltransferase